jgi:hypothetical protein
MKNLQTQKCGQSSLERAQTSISPLAAQQIERLCLVVVPELPSHAPSVQGCILPTATHCRRRISIDVGMALASGEKGLAEWNTHPRLSILDRPHLREADLRPVVVCSSPSE